MKIEIVVGNIVKQPDMEAVVNSANPNLRLGSGVAGAIHMAAGPKLEAYCKPYAPLAFGAFLVTPGFKLPNLWVIHLRAASYEVNADAPGILAQAVVPVLPDDTADTLAARVLSQEHLIYPQAVAQFLAQSPMRSKRG